MVDSSTSVGVMLQFIQLLPVFCWTRMRSTSSTTLHTTMFHLLIAPLGKRRDLTWSVTVIQRITLTGKDILVSFEAKMDQLQLTITPRHVSILWDQWHGEAGRIWEPARLVGSINVWFSMMKALFKRRDLIYQAWSGKAAFLCSVYELGP